MNLLKAITFNIRDERDIKETDKHNIKYKIHTKVTLIDKNYVCLKTFSDPSCYVH